MPKDASGNGRRQAMDIAVTPAVPPQHSPIVGASTRANGGQADDDVSSERLADPAPSPAKPGMRRRSDSIMEKIMNPVLDRDGPPSPVSERHAKRSIPAVFQSPGYHKAPAFDRELHAMYVRQYPTGIRGLFVLVQSPILMVAIGAFAAGVGLFIDYWLAKIAVYHSVLSVWGFRYFLLSALGAVSLSAMLVHFVCPQSAGSGLPFMKVALSGIDMSEYMSLKCVVTKIVGLVLAMAAGLSIGKEGPFIMISCGFASIIMNTKPFRRIYNDEAKRLEMLACGVAAGVAATFGSPFGGVLFGVEVTSHYYLVGTLPRSFFTAIVGALLVNFMTADSRYGLMASYNMGITEVGDPHGFDLRDLCIFSALGVVCGLGGALFNHSVCMLVRIRDYYYEPTVATFVSMSAPLRKLWNGFGKRLALVLAITFISCFLEFYGDSAWFIRHGSPRRILSALFSKDARIYSGEPGDEQAPETEEESLLLSRSLVTFLPLKFLLTLVSIVLPIPAGLFTPTFVIGGILGRLVGEAIHAFDLLPTLYEPYEFAIVGAAAFSSGVTHAISTAVIIMEVSHTDGLNLPISVAILAAYFTTKRFTESVYDMLITTSRLPRLKKLPKAAYDVPSWEVMKDVSNMRFLTPDYSYRDALAVLNRSDELVFPIIDSPLNRFLVGTVTRSKLATAIKHCQKSKNLSPQTPSHAAEASATVTSSLLTPPRTPPYGAVSYGSTVNDGGSEDEDEQDEVELLDTPIHFAIKRGGRVMDWVSRATCWLLKQGMSTDELVALLALRREPMHCASAPKPPC